MYVTAGLTGCHVNESPKFRAVRQDRMRSRPPLLFEHPLSQHIFNAQKVRPHSLIKALSSSAAVLKPVLHAGTISGIEH